MELRDAPVDRRGRDAGGAIVEFIGMAILLLIPIVYLIVALARIQGAAFSAEEAAQAAARGAVVEGVSALEHGASEAEAERRAVAWAEAAAVLSAQDFGFAPADVAVALQCSTTPCFLDGSVVDVSVEVTVALPGIPSGMRAWAPLGVAVSSSATASVDDLAGGP